MVQTTSACRCCRSKMLITDLLYVFVTISVICVREIVCDFKLQIVHTNDLHARFLEVDKNTLTCTQSQAKQNKCYGGFARIRQASIQAAEEAKKQNIPTIFLNAGDSFQGTPYYTTLKWEIIAPLTESLKFDAMCLGNHEFDEGIDNLVQYLTHVKTPIVTTNIDLGSDPRLSETNVKKSIEMIVGNIRIGIIGYLTPETTNLIKGENLRILDEILSVRDEAKRLKSKGIQLIIALGHSGFQKDQEVATEVEEVDVIIGGHSHSLLHTPKDKPPSTEFIEEEYPFWVTQKSGKKVPIVQAFAFTKYLGKLIITLNNTNNVIAAEGNTFLLDHTYPKNAEVEKLVQSWTGKLKDRLDTVLGNTRVPLEIPPKNCIHQESAFINLITDALIEKSVFLAKGKNLQQWTPHAAAFYLNSGVRASVDNSRNGGNITIGDILTVIPFTSQILECSAPGLTLKEILEVSVEKFNPNAVQFDNFLQFSGLRVIYNLQKPPKNRVHTVNIICTQCSVPKYEQLDQSKSYKIIIDSYILKVAPEYTTLRANCKDVKLLDPSDPRIYDIVREYLQRHQIVYPKIDGRIQMFGNNKTQNK